MNYRADIDGLRAIAVLLVLVFHFKLISIGDAGFIGVDIFFVISGFLITNILYKHVISETLNYGDFYARRIRRLFPPLAVTLVGFLAIGWWFALPDIFAELALETATSVVYGSNIYFWRNVSYFGLQAVDVPLLHTWSLAVEEQFYIIFPLIFGLLARRLTLQLLIVAMITVTISSFALNIFFVASKPMAAFYLLPTRAWEMTLGGTIALFAIKYPAAMPRFSWLGVPGCVAITAAIFLYDPSVAVPGWITLGPTLGAAMLIVAGYNQGGWTKKLMSLPFLVIIGKISYSLYLVHWPIIIITSWILTDAGVLAAWIGFALSFAIAAVMYVAIEAPVRERRIWATNRRLVLAYFGSSIATLAICAAIWFSGGAAGRFPAEVGRLLAFKNDRNETVADCEISKRGFCAIGVLGVAPSAMVIGDSHADATAGAYDIWLKSQGRAGVLLFQHGCLPIEGTGKPACADMLKAAHARLIDDDLIRDVFVISIWRQGFNGPYPIEGRWLEPEEAQARLIPLLAKTTAMLGSTDARVILVEPMNVAKRSVPEAMARQIAFGKNLDVDRMRAEYFTDHERLFTAFKAVEGLGVIRLSLIDAFCDDLVCHGELDGDPIFRDNNHLHGGMAQRLAEEIAKQILIADTPLTSPPDTAPSPPL
jgi:peptidoglycan/LPS O-acetylase OafA/YrhL